MEQFNKAISFILGLIVVVIFLAVATGRINLRGRLPLFSRATPTPTMKVTPTPLRQPTGIAGRSVFPTASPSNPLYHPYSGKGTPSTIPSTGPELLFPMAAISFFGGVFLRMLDKKKQ